MTSFRFFILFSAIFSSCCARAEISQSEWGEYFAERPCLPGVLVGRPAPDFVAEGVVAGKIAKISLIDFRGEYVVLFFYPLDFTFVCPTELHAFQARLEEFTKRGARVIGCSVDSCYAHLAWLRTPKEKGGIQGVSYPLLSDLSKSIAEEYGVLIEEASIAHRALFIIDEWGIVRYQVVNDLPIGRSISEVLRVLDALICVEEEGGVCPADWQLGEETMEPTQEGVEEYFQGR